MAIVYSAIILDTDYWDVFDVDFASDMNTASTTGISDKLDTQESYYITPYEAGYLDFASNNNYSYKPIRCKIY